MRPVQLGQPANDNDTRWTQEALREIERASQDETEAAFDDYTITNLTETRTIDCDTITLAGLADVVGTMIQEFQQRGRRNQI